MIGHHARAPGIPLPGGAGRRYAGNGGLDAAAVFGGTAAWPEIPAVLRSRQDLPCAIRQRGRQRRPPALRRARRAIPLRIAREAAGGFSGRLHPLGGMEMAMNRIEIEVLSSRAAMAAFARAWRQTRAGRRAVPRLAFGSI